MQRLASYSLLIGQTSNKYKYYSNIFAVTDRVKFDTISKLHLTISLSKQDVSSTIASKLGSSFSSKKTTDCIKTFHLKNWFCW